MGSTRARRVSYLFLCVVPFVATLAVGVRAFRVPGLYQLAGVLLFVAIALAAWQVGGRSLASSGEERKRLALVAGLLLSPFALVSLLWVGIGMPWEATPPENRLRYGVLLVSSLAVAGAFMIVKDALAEAGERLLSALAFSAAVPAGAAYLVWTSFQVGAYSMKVAHGELPQAVVAMSDVEDTLLFAGSVLTYLASIALVASLRRAGWLGRGAALGYLIALALLLCSLLARGVSFPDPNAGPTPWYLRPGFVAGIPAVPWIVPFFLGVVLLRRAGENGSRPPSA